MLFFDLQALRTMTENNLQNSTALSIDRTQNFFSIQALANIHLLKLVFMSSDKCVVVTRQKWNGGTKG